MEEAPTLNFSAIYDLFVSMHLVFCSAQIKEAAFRKKYTPYNLPEHLSVVICRLDFMTL